MTHENLELALQETVDEETVYNNRIPIEAHQGRFCFYIASDREFRERAYRLAYRVYRDTGLTRSYSSEMIISPYDAAPHMFTLLVTDRMTGCDAGTISLVLDREGLPSDSIYGDELMSLRFQDRLLVEVTRLAIDDRYRRSQSLFAQMTNIISIFSRKVWNATDWVIEVNPRHVKFYEKKYLFTQIGGLKSCRRVEGAPAILLNLNLAMQGQVIRTCAGKQTYNDPDLRRTVYPDYRSIEQEKGIAEILKRNYTVMNYGDALYFGLEQEYKHCYMAGIGA